MHYLKNFLENLPFATNLLKKILTLNKEKLDDIDPRVTEKLIELWIYITLNRDYFVIQHTGEIRELAFLSPNLIQTSGKSYTNSFLIHHLLNHQKYIDKYRRHFKHILREKMIELRP